VSHVVSVVSLVTLPVTVTGNRYGDGDRCGDRYGDGYCHGNRYGNGDGYRYVSDIVTVPVSYEVDAHIYNTYN